MQAGPSVRPTARTRTRTMLESDLYTDAAPSARCGAPLCDNTHLLLPKCNADVFNMRSRSNTDDVICCRYLMFILPTGSRTKGYKNCSHRIEGETEKRRQRKVQEEEGALRAPLSPPPSPPKPPPRSQLYSSKSLAGPWTTILPQPFPNCNNPSPAVHPTNGTKYLLCHGGTKGYGPGYFLYLACIVHHFHQGSAENNPAFGTVTRQH